MAQTKKKTNRGGVRVGAGRKPSDVSLKSITIRLHPDLIKAIDRHGQRSKIIREAINEYLRYDRSNNR